MKKKVLIWVLAAVLVLSMAGCAAGAVSSNDKYVGMEPVAAAEAAAAETKDTTSISDLIRVPFGYLLDCGHVCRDIVRMFQIRRIGWCIGGKRTDIDIQTAVAGLSGYYYEKHQFDAVCRVQTRCDG